MVIRVTMKQLEMTRMVCLMSWFVLRNSELWHYYNLYHEDTDAVVASKKGNGGLLIFWQYS